MNIFWEIKKLSKMKINDMVLATSLYCVVGIEVKVISQIRVGWVRSERLEVANVGNSGQ